jgi:predicted nucleic acid-binding protein
VSLFVDTSVWSLLLRRDRPADVPQVRALVRALETGERVVTTGLVLQELLQGFSGAKAQDLIVDRFAAFPLLAPDREDHIAAASLRNLVANAASKLEPSMPCSASYAYVMGSCC